MFKNNLVHIQQQQQTSHTEDDIQKGKTGKNISCMHGKSTVVICQKHVDERPRFGGLFKLFPTHHNINIHNEEKEYW